MFCFWSCFCFVIGVASLWFYVGLCFVLSGVGRCCLCFCSLRLFCVCVVSMFMCLFCCVGVGRAVVFGAVGVCGFRVHVIVIVPVCFVVVLRSQWFCVC